MPKVTFQPGGHSVEVPAGYTIFDAAELLNMTLPTDCGGAGTCGKCRVRFLEEVPEPNEADLDLIPAAGLVAGYRLACQREVIEDVIVEVPSQSGARPTKGMAAVGGAELELDPLVSCVPLAELDEAEVRWAEGVRDGLGSSKPSGDGREAVVFEREVLAVRTAGERPLLGVAFDIGTTTIGGYLMDLETGEDKATLAIGNPQGAHGADVISRIHYANTHPDGLKRMQGLCVSALNELLADMTDYAGASSRDVFYVTAVGNPTMMHLLLGVDPRSIAGAPFHPVFKDAQVTTARAISLGANPAAKVETLPMVSGYVGADTVGMALYLRLDQRDEVCIAIDVGTNGEVVLCNRGQLYACSTAAGPAFEGARITWGMRAQPGAIDSFSYDSARGRFIYHTIGDARPQGICGPGLLSVVATLLEAGVIEPNGRFSAECQLPTGRLRNSGAQCEFVLAGADETEHGQDVVLTQRDIRELQLAKSAMAAGMYRLLGYAGLTLADVDRIYLAGAFGSFLDPWSARRIGLLLPIPTEHIVAVGNAAGAGGRLVLCSKNMRRTAADIAHQVDYLELSGDIEFNELFMQKMEFPANDVQVCSTCAP
ncbi:MAG: ASKHA domain-containing protein [Chloroflexi bacterium]|nr:ASKHA domain-containing protein [Chloroflexota bacterium]MCL5025821.1 ASKHA domain-containing protein [Chloroflexota bacterium]